MKTTIEKVREFHKAFRQPYDRQPGKVRPSVEESDWAAMAGVQLAGLGRTLKMAAERYGKSVPLLRLQLLVEEVGELAEAIAADDQVEMLDALTDIQYVLDGSYLSFGMDTLKEEAFELVHASNMAKLDTNRKPIIGPSGRVVKPEGWLPPDLGGLLNGT